MEEKENYFSCDYCHRVGTGITIVNGFKMCPMCLAEYQHKSGENNELREEFGKNAREVEQLKKENEELLKKILGQKLEIKSLQSKFNSVAERYHLLNRLQARYGDKNKLHLSEIHCLMLIKENEELKSAQNSLAVEKLEGRKK